MPGEGLTRGFTTIELVITLCILSILLAIAVPSAGTLLDRIHVHAAADEIEAMFGVARHLAIARASNSTVDIDALGTMYISISGDTLRKREVAAAEGVQLATTRARMSYGPTGVGYGAANLSVVVQRNGFSDTVFVSRLGRVRH
jgi:prepilin-type N-terminal cleavage/methylation domain-containing protein